MNDSSARIIEIDVNDILPNRFQPRIQFNEEEILELSDSIKEHGIIQPIIVRSIGDKYEIIAGERRYKAAVLAGKDNVPVIVKNLSDRECAEIALIENIQRKNLTPIEEALSYKKILDMNYMTQADLANKLGKSQPAVANKIRLLNLSDEIKEALLENKISERHARSLLRLKSSKDQNYMLERIIKERLTVRKTDEEILKFMNEKEERGEMKMNENMNQTPNFDIFGTPQPQPAVQNVNGTDMLNQPSIANTPVSQPTFEEFSQPTQAPEPPSFDIFGSTNIPVEPEEKPSIIQNPEVQEINNNTFGFAPAAQPAIPETPNFDIFGTSQPQPAVNTQTEAPVQPQVEPTPVTPVEPVQPQVEPVVETPSFDIFGPTNIPVEPEEKPSIIQNPEVQEINNNTFGFAPASQPAAPNFDIFGAPQPQPAVNTQTEAPVPPVPVQLDPVQPQVEPTPVTPVEPVQPQVEPVIETPNFDIFNNQTPVESQNNNVPVTSPILEEQQPINNTLEFPSSAQPTPVEPEVQTINNVDTSVQPIIVTDYNKQYDPVMPADPLTLTPTADFKEVIKAIRECQSKIESYGYMLDVEEYDLENLYQAVFKIEKQ